MSNIVSIKIIWQPPSTSPAIYSLYEVTSSQKVTFLNAGSSTLGETEAVRFVGPIAPATNRLHSGVEILFVAFLAKIEAYLFISNTKDSSL